MSLFEETVFFYKCTSIFSCVIIKSAIGLLFSVYDYTLP